MRLTVLLVIAACGGDTVHHLADAPPGIDAAPDQCPAGDSDGKACDPNGVCCGGACVGGGTCCSVADCPSSSYTCSQYACVDVTGTLTGLLWQLPCGGDLSSTICTADATATQSAVVGGSDGITYDITVRLRGVVEQKTYANGCAAGYWLQGGADNGDSYNVYELTVSSPPQTYFLNNGASGIQNSYAIDYTKTIRADAGATVTLFAASKDNQEIKNLDTAGAPITVDGTTVTQPYNGQFIEMDVTSVVPDPVASSAHVGGGSSGDGLAFDGAAQYASAADAPSLDAGDVTTETWFDFAGAGASYNGLVCKGYGTGSQDSYCTWFESGALHAGINLGSASNSATVPWVVTTGEWHHVAFVYDHATQVSTLYIDGSVAGCATNAAPILSDADPLFAGADYNNGGPMGFFHGELDEVRVFSVARTSDQIWADMHTHVLGPTAGLVAEWAFDDGAGQTATDSSGAGNTGTLGATSAAAADDPTWVTSTAP